VCTLISYNIKQNTKEKNGKIRNRENWYFGHIKELDLTPHTCYNIFHLLPIHSLKSDTLTITGNIFVLSGLSILIISQMQLKTFYSILLSEKKTKLGVNGLFTISKNSIYTGAYLSFLGMFLMVPSWIFALAIITFLVNNHFRILEEKSIR